MPKMMCLRSVSNGKKLLLSKKIGACVRSSEAASERAYASVCVYCLFICVYVMFWFFAALCLLVCVLLTK